MKSSWFQIFLTFVTTCWTLDTNPSDHKQLNQWDDQRQYISNNHPSHSIISHPPLDQWNEEDVYKYVIQDAEVTTTTDRYHVPAVMEGGLLRAQIPQHTLIAIDRFLRILKRLAGFAILLAIGMPFIHEITSSIFEETLKYLS